MGTKLDWVYQDRCNPTEYHAVHNGFRIRAVNDLSPSNPFEDQDGNWPMLVRYGGRVKLYEKTGGHRADNPLARISDTLLVHDQIAIAKALGVTIETVTEYHDAGPMKYLNDADFLRTYFQDIIDDNREQGDALETYAALFRIAGIVCHCAASNGYSQGDSAEVLVVATPEAIEQFGCTQPITEADLEGTVKLYSAWAWGDVYGYIIEREVPDPHPEVDEYREREWEELDSCWGFYGSDFDWSGLEEAAMAACPAPVKEDA